MRCADQIVSIILFVLTADRKYREIGRAYLNVKRLI